MQDLNTFIRTFCTPVTEAWGSSLRILYNRLATISSAQVLTNIRHNWERHARGSIFRQTESNFMEDFWRNKWTLVNLLNSAAAASKCSGSDFLILLLHRENLSCKQWYQKRWDPSALTDLNTGAEWKYCFDSQCCRWPRQCFPTFFVSHTSLVFQLNSKYPTIPKVQVII